MDKDTSNKLSELHLKSKEAAEMSEVFDAAVTLGEIWNCVEDMPNRTKYYWKGKIDDIWKELEAPNSLTAEIANQLSRLQRMTGFGDKFEYEELVAIIMERIELDLVLALMPPIDPSVRLLIEQLDNDIRSLVQQGRNRRYFKSARKSLRKNWGSPIRHWLID